MTILGIHDGHNATAALMRDGVLLAAISEERLTYKKNDMGFPVNAIRECLRITGISATEIDVVAFSTQSFPLQYLRIKREYAFSIRDWLSEQEEFWKPKIFEGRINHSYLERVLKDPRFREPQAYDFSGIPLELSPEENKAALAKLRVDTLERLFGIPAEKIVALRHHECHQHYAYYGSPASSEPTLIITSDGGGDGENGTVSVAREGVIEKIASNNCTDLARIYRYITLLLGMKIGEHEYKVMGLAPYASAYEVRKTDKAFKNIFEIRDLLVQYHGERPKDLFFHFRDLLADCRFDGIAGGVQEMVEEVGSTWFKAVTEELGLSRVVFSGGLSMNVKMNKVIGELPSVKYFYVPPSGGDESVAIGACYKAHMMRGGARPTSMENAYLGPEPLDADIEAALEELSGCSIRPDATNADVARLLADGLVIGRMYGRMEFGARSLGNRSILADPSDPRAVRKINQKIKARDFWMPFAPSVLESYADRYLVNPKGFLSDHMTLSMETTELGRQALAAAIHPYDSTARPHIVRKEINPTYHDLIEEFAKITGTGGLLNTSFNLHGLPVVCTPSQAVHVFKNSELDAMAIGSYLVTRT